MKTQTSKAGCDLDYWDDSHPLRVQEQRFIRGLPVDIQTLRALPDFGDYRERRLREILVGLEAGESSITVDPQARDLLRRRNAYR